jgi:hypothetical protein
MCKYYTGMDRTKTYTYGILVGKPEEIVDGRINKQHGSVWSLFIGLGQRDSGELL